jgi:hypothetical protein
MCDNSPLPSVMPSSLTGMVQCYRQHHHRWCCRTDWSDWLTAPHPFLDRLAGLPGLLFLVLRGHLTSHLGSVVLWVCSCAAFTSKSTSDEISINTYIGSSCMLIMLEAIWPSLKKYPNTIPSSVGVTSNRMIAYAVFWICESRRVLRCSSCGTSSLVASAVPAGHDPPPEDAMAVLCQIRRSRHWLVRHAGMGSSFGARNGSPVSATRKSLGIRPVVGVGGGHQRGSLRQDDVGSEYGSRNDLIRLD